LFQRIKTYLQEVWAEMAKVSWPSREEVRGATVVVLITVALMTVFIGVVDQILNRLLKLILG
jgi:preprotein translocase subunit SecE